MIRLMLNHILNVNKLLLLIVVVSLYISLNEEKKTTNVQVYVCGSIQQMAEIPPVAYI